MSGHEEGDCSRQSQQQCDRSDIKGRSTMVDTLSKFCTTGWNSRKDVFKYLFSRESLLDELI